VESASWETYVDLPTARASLESIFYYERKSFNIRISNDVGPQQQFQQNNRPGGNGNGNGGGGRGAPPRGGPGSRGGYDRGRGGRGGSQNGMQQGGYGGQMNPQQGQFGGQPQMIDDKGMMVYQSNFFLPLRLKFI
jgi:hypothetical protein